MVIVPCAFCRSSTQNGYEVCFLQCARQANFKYVVMAGILRLCWNISLLILNCVTLIVHFRFQQ